MRDDERAHSQMAWLNAETRLLHFAGQFISRLSNEEAGSVLTEDTPPRTSRCVHKAMHTTAASYEHGSMQMCSASRLRGLFLERMDNLPVHLPRHLSSIYWRLMLSLLWHIAHIPTSQDKGHFGTRHAWPSHTDASARSG